MPLPTHPPSVSEPRRRTGRDVKEQTDEPAMSPAHSWPEVLTALIGGADLSSGQTA